MLRELRIWLFGGGQATEAFEWFRVGKEVGNVRAGVIVRWGDDLKMHLMTVRYRPILLKKSVFQATQY